MDVEKAAVRRTAYRGRRRAKSWKHDKPKGFVPSFITSAIVAVVTWLVAGDALGNVWGPLLGFAAGFVLWEFALRPLRNYMWTVPEQEHIDLFCANDDLTAKIRALEAQQQAARSRPRLIAMGTHRVPFEIVSFIADNRKISGHAVGYNFGWKNEPVGAPSPDAVAKNIRAFVEIWADGQMLLDYVARWDETPQPQRFQPKAPLTAIDLGRGESRMHSLVVKPEGHFELFAFNNDSYGYPDLQNPHFRLTHPEGPTEYSIIVRIKGENVDAEARLKMTYQPAFGADPQFEVI